MFATVAAIVGLVNTRWGLHLDADAIITWLGTVLAAGVLTRQTVVSPATAEKKVEQAQNIGYLQGHMNPQGPPQA